MLCILQVPATLSGIARQRLSCWRSLTRDGRRQRAFRIFFEPRALNLATLLVFHAMCACNQMQRLDQRLREGPKVEVQLSRLDQRFRKGHKSTTFDLDQIPFSTCNALLLLRFYAMPLREWEKGLVPGQKATNHLQRLTSA